MHANTLTNNTRSRSKAIRSSKMSKFKINDRVVVVGDFFKNLKDQEGSVVSIIPKTAMSMEMFQVVLDLPKLGSIENIMVPFFEDEIKHINVKEPNRAS
jgi:hypothetical protein